MATGRSKKPKPPKIQEGKKITLGLKTLVVTSLGFMGVLVWVFILGVLVGRGDVYRVLHNWGLLKAELVNPNQLPPVASVSAPLNGAMVPANQSGTLSPAPSEKPAPLASSTPKSPQAKATTQPPKKEAPKKPVAQKFIFQNSVDHTPTKQVKVQKSKAIQKAKAVPAGTKPSSTGSQPRVVTKAKSNVTQAVKTAKQPETAKQRSSTTPRIIKATIAPDPAGGASSR
ncbi:MAG: hypothetical protein PHW74_13065 [Desulfobacca sp.]|nr:hypothetical protein [Desulfobacca sp.]